MFLFCTSSNHLNISKDIEIQDSILQQVHYKWELLMVRKDRVSRTFIYHLLRIARELIKFLIWYDSVAWRTSQVPFGYIRLKRNEKYLLFYWLPDSDTYCIPQHSTISKLRQIPQYVSVISFWWRKIAFNSLVDVSSYWILSFSLALYSFPCIHLYMCCIFLVSFLPRRFFLYYFWICEMKQGKQKNT